MTPQEKTEKADRRYDLIVWDWDGTIMDKNYQILDTLAYLYHAMMKCQETGTLTEANLIDCATQFWMEY